MDIVVHCPHCGLPAPVTAADIDKGALYHGTLKKNGRRLRDRVPAEWVQYLYDNDMIYGCGKPFFVIRKSSIQFEAVPFNPMFRGTSIRRSTVIPCERVASSSTD
jgi:hypothetical protein